MKTRNGTLSPMEHKAIDLYIEYGNMRRAMVEAGYAETTAVHGQNRFFKRKCIAAALQQRLADEMSSKEVLHRLGKLAREAASEGDRIRALELLGKKHRLFTDRLEHEIAKSVEELIVGADRKLREREAQKVG